MNGELDRIITTITTVAEHDKPYELCICVQSADGETRIDHEDYLLTLDELKALHAAAGEKLRLLAECERYLARGTHG